MIWIAYDLIEKRGTSITVVNAKRRSLHVSKSFMVTEARAHAF